MGLLMYSFTIIILSTIIGRVIKPFACTTALGTNITQIVHQSSFFAGEYARKCTYII